MSCSGTGSRWRRERRWSWDTNSSGGRVALGGVYGSIHDGSIHEARFSEDRPGRNGAVRVGRRGGGAKRQAIRNRLGHARQIEREGDAARFWNRNIQREGAARLAAGRICEARAARVVSADAIP